MKGLSVKQRVMIWFTTVLLLMAVLVFLILQTSSARQADAYGRDTLYRAVQAAMDEVEYRNGAWELDDDLDDIDYAHIMLYDESGRVMLYGPIPDFDAPLLDGAVQRAAGDTGSTWYVYDLLHETARGGRLWIRACLNMDSLLRMEGYTKNIFLYMMLPLILIGALGGYAVTRRAFRPIAQMAETTNRIAGGSDLSARIGLTSQDEFGRLGGAIDGMLARLEAAFEQEKRFTADASHELRTPLSVIKAQCDLALRRDDPAQQRESLSVIAGQADRLTRMVRELLTLSRMDANTQPLTLEQVDLAALAQAVAEELRPAAGEKGIALTVDAPARCMLLADEMLMLRLFMNLLGNAIQFGRPGGHALLALREEPGAVTGRVEDDGIGIAPENLPHIWERFWQADRARSRDSGSSGLGLSMARWIVEAHHGEITVQSAPGRGSVFAFRLPRQAGGAANASRKG